MNEMKRGETNRLGWSGKIKGTLDNDENRNIHAAKLL